MCPENTAAKCAEFLFVSVITFFHNARFRVDCRFGTVNAKLNLGLLAMFTF